MLDPAQAAQRGLLMVVLALLSLEGGKLEEGALLAGAALPPCLGAGVHVRGLESRC